MRFISNPTHFQDQIYRSFHLITFQIWAFMEDYNLIKSEAGGPSVLGKRRYDTQVMRCLDMIMIFRHMSNTGCPKKLKDF